MTVSSSVNKVTYSGNSATLVFPVNYYFLENSHLQVILVFNNVETIQTLTSQYTVTGAGNPAGGSVTMVAAPPTGTQLIIVRNVPATQETDYLANDPFPAESHERALDKLTMLVQQNTTEIDRALKIPLSSLITTSTEIPAPQANKLLAWNSTANAIINFDPSAVINIVGQQASFSNVFTGDGVTVNFTLDRPPGNVNAIDVSVQGASQKPNIDYILNGSILTFTTAPPNLTSILARYSEVFAEPAVDAVNVRYTPSGTGAVLTDAQTKLRQIVSVKDFGATGDGVTDDTLSIQAAIDYLSPLGGTLYIPKGAYIVSDANADNACLIVTAPIQFLGAGAFYTSIQPAAGVAGTVNTILVNPNTGFDQTLMSFKKLSLGNLNNGTRQGNHGIYCLTLDAGQNLPKFTVEDCAIQQGGGAAIYHLNDPVDNINGGMYACYINNNTLKGGITFENSGDSLVVSNNILSGTGTGVSAALVTGASLLSIIDNNITTTNSAIIIAGGMRVSILRNNIEHYTTGANSNAVIDIVSSGGTYVAGVIQQNLVSAFGSTDASKLIAIREARGTLIQDNTFLAGVGGITAIDISSTCTSIRVGANSYNTGVATKVTDAGTGTMGVVKTITLQNSWVANTASDTPTYYKDLSGNVVIEGAIKDGTAVAGTTLFALPVGFRPPTGTLKRFNAYSVGGGGAEFGRFEIDQDGTARIEDGANTLFNLSGAVYRASDGANSVSPE